MPTSKAHLCLLLVACVCLLSADATVLWIKGGTVVNADRQFVADVVVANGRVTQIGEHLPEYHLQFAKVIDARGKYVMPGGIDTHTHLDGMFMGQKTPDDFYSGQAAALAGGTTFHMDMLMPEPGGDILAGFERHSKAAERSVMDYSFHIVITHWNEQTRKAMTTLVERGMTSFKFFMAYKRALQVSDELLVNAFQHCKELGALPLVHAENGDAIFAAQQRLVAAGITGPEGHQLSRPPIVEEEAALRAITLAKVINVPLFIVHVMSKGAMDVIARARAAGQRVLGEALAAGIGLNQSLIWSPDFKTAAKFVMSPPIRSEEQRLAVRAGLAGGALQLVATDHCGWTAQQKARGRNSFLELPNGVNGIEERMHITWQQLVNSGLATPSRFVEVTSTAAAKAFNLFPRKGIIKPGADADLIILDPNISHTITASGHHSQSDLNIFEGHTVRGKVVTTISQGKLVWDNAKLNVERGAGRLIPRPAFGSLFEGLDARAAGEQAETYPYGPMPVNRDSPTCQSQQEL